MATTVPYTVSTSSLERFLGTIPTIGTPPKVNGPYLKGLGFKSGNDSYLVPIFKQLGFLDGAGVPLDRWRQYRNASEARAVMASAIETAYADLFHTYPDAHRKDDEALRNWVRARTDFDDTKVKQAVATFRTLCKYADFDDTRPQTSSTTSQSANEPSSTRASTSAPVGGQEPAPVLIQLPAAPSVTINIQLTLPPSADADVYDKFFQAMKRHLYPDGSRS